MFIKIYIILNNIKGLIFYGNNGEGISGDVKLTLNKNSNAVMSVVPQETEYTENDVTEAKLITWAKLWANTGDEKNWCFEENVTYYMAVAPQNYSKGFTAQLEVAGVGLVDVRKLSRSKELEPGFIYDLGELSYVVTPKVEKVYLRPGIWAADGAWFSAHFWGAKEEDLKLTEEQNGLFSVSVTEGQTGMKLCRMNPKYDVFSWDSESEDDHVWDETDDLSIPEAGSDKICYVMTDWNAGDWMTIEEALAYVEEETPPTPENPMTPGENSEWAIIGAFNGWKDQILVAESADVVVAKSLKLKAAEGFLVRKPSTDWEDKYGASGVNYIKANHYVKTSQGGSDLCVEADGTYDIYFNVTTKAIYVMTSGVAYATAKEQTSNGKEPVQEEPEVTDKTIYLKPNANWKVDNARFAAYFFGNGETWVSMTDSDADGIYEVNLPVGFDYGCNVIFCRMNPGTTGNNWNNKWNQTDDLVVPTTGNNLYTVKEGTWDKGGGEWSKK